LMVTHVSGDTLFTLSNLADYMAQDGTFELSVDLTGIVSLASTAGLIQQKVMWKVDTTPPSIVEVKPNTSKGFDWQHYSNFEVKFSEEVTNFNLDQIELWKDNVRQPLSQIHLDELNDSTYLLSQFRLLTYYEGDYKLVLHMEEIADVAGLTGSDVFEYEWTVNRDLPAPVENLRVTPDLGISSTDGVTSTKELSAVMNVTQAGNKVELYLNDNGTMTQLSVKSNVPVGELTIPFTLPTGGHMRIEAHSVNDTGSPSIVSIPVFIDEAPLTAVIKGFSAGVRETHPDPLSIVFSRNIMESTLGDGLFKVYHNNVAITLPDIDVTQVSDSVFSLSGLSLLPITNGNYSIKMDTRGLRKQTSGLKGANVVEATWRLETTNRAPIANAGSDQLITQSGTYQLDGSTSSDPDNESLTYKWYAPDGIVLNDASLVNPEFAISGATLNKTYTFILSVDDGKVVRNDKVDVVVLLATSTEDEVQEISVTVFPNPSKGMVYLSGDVNNVHRIQVFDMSGRSVYISGPSEEAPIQLDLNHLSKGMYNILIFIEKKVISRKVVIIP